MQIIDSRLILSFCVSNILKKLFFTQGGVNRFLIFKVVVACVGGGWSEINEPEACHEGWGGFHYD